MRKKAWGKNVDTGRLRDPADVPSVSVVPNKAVTEQVLKEFDRLLGAYGLEIIKWSGTPGETLGFSIEGRPDVGSRPARAAAEEA